MIMTKRESSNLGEIIKKLNMEECLDVFLLGVEGRVSVEETVAKINEKKEIRDRS